MLGNPAFASAAMRQRVAPATEHLPAIKLTLANLAHTINRLIFHERRPTMG